jgi:hypothetical protein
MATSRGNTTGRAAASGNTYYKNSGVKVTVPARNINSKQTIAGEEAMGRAQDTGRGRGPLRGVARRSREGADLESGKYPSQNVTKSSARANARLEGKIVDGKLAPTPETPVKRSTTGKTTISSMASKRGPSLLSGGGLGGVFGIKNR